MGCVTTEASGKVGARTDCYMPDMSLEKGRGRGVVDDCS